MKEFKNDKQILKELAEKVSNIASLSIQDEKKRMWTLLNDLKSVKPMIWINEIPWHEMAVGDELRLQTSDKFCRILEEQLRKIIYQWEHMRGDMIVDNKISCPLIIHDTGFGIFENTDFLKKDKKSHIISRHFKPQIENEDDIEKIKMPIVTFDKETTDYNYQRMLEIFDGVLEVVKEGKGEGLGFWFAPWDLLVKWFGVQEAMTSLLANPQLVHAAMAKLVNAYLHRLDQFEELNLLSLNNGNYRIGSGGLGYTDQLPGINYNSNHIIAADLWGSSTAQIFSEVSPAMHEEFSLQYEKLWLKRFGLNYYGCCEPLDKKIDILIKNIPNLRKISISPWANFEEAIKKIENKYVISYKPNPAIFLNDNWDSDIVKKELINILKKAEGCALEVIMKDISTVNYKPERLWKWANIASDISERIK